MADDLSSPRRWALPHLPFPSAEQPSAAPIFWPFGAIQEYWLDAAQRSILLLDALRQRGDTQITRSQSVAPNVLSFEVELLLDGRSLPRPVNYGLVRIVPPAGIATDPGKRPFIVFDPRAGHGPGIGGMKQESEIGVAIAAGHPCYFVGFLPEAMPGQTIEDVCEAEAHFVQAVIARHPDAESRPCLIGNCQAGWQIMMMSAIHPELPGPILLAGAPLSYWAGVRGKNPMRYTGGLLGGSWLTAMTGDMGHGTFDGAHLIANFESLNPSNTHWTKLYNVYSKVDTEAARFLDFETWWGNPVTLNATEMQFIVDELFIGNKLSAGAMTTRDGTRMDLRNITSPIIVFCSWGDDITPPQQALGWLTDLYATDAQMLGAGQTVIYTVHQTIGHLGIFVSGKVASKEHGEFTNCMDMIEMLPPGLYEAVITEVAEGTAHPELIHGKYLFHLEPRGLDDIRALGGNSPADERRFETVARVSEINRGLYQQFLAPVVRAMSSAESAEFLRKTHPNRLRFEMFASKNPMLAAIPAMAEAVRQDRRPVGEDNPFLWLERQFSTGMVTLLNAYRDSRDMMMEAMFLATYGSPLVQTLVGLGAAGPTPGRREPRDLLRDAAAAEAAVALERNLAQGGLREALLRGLIYILRAERRFDERSASVIETMRLAQPREARLTLPQFRDAVRSQALLLRQEEARAIAAIPAMLPEDNAARSKGFAALREVVLAQGALSEAGQARLDELAGLFGIPPKAEAPRVIEAPPVVEAPILRARPLARAMGSVSEAPAAPLAVAKAAVAKPSAPRAVVPKAPASKPVVPKAPAAKPSLPKVPVPEPVVPKAPASKPVVPKAPAAKPSLPKVAAPKPVAVKAAASKPVAPKRPASKPPAPVAPAQPKPASKRAAPAKPRAGRR
ncbi:DUF3141 domain-containing protein [Sediminicoccus sp. KRV36]|uniref:DUF3141 domain-containing protein n=1 Tax=Sediminicoccus sp. KRV36 TaxID=3133721 RepID=UPI00200D6C64|nr:DUF3141 domain-containing protein [Sediminicoccus rosea]UPY38450.1 DUF3141 domain-containing protein [Sediminicoccus rosea]